jgi:asparagine synthase (glutamine-hydrolysing)
MEDSGILCRYIGSQEAVSQLKSFLIENPNPSQESLKKKLLDLCGTFAAIIQTNRHVIAVVDKIRSYPIFYIQNGHRYCLSNSARMLKEHDDLSSINDLSLLEFRMAGYVTGKETLYENLYQLQAGEFLVWCRDTNKIKRERYYQFYFREFMESNEDELIKRLACATDAVFDRLVKDLGGRPVWVPLSAGLDSRLVVAKLVERGYPNIETFSYGKAGNHEARHAEKVAHTLGLPWRFVPTTSKAMRAFHESKQRREYWEFCDGLSSIPNPQDIVPLIALRNQNELPPDAVIVNGQSGDFICGAHIPVALTKKDATVELLLDIAISKHFSLWLDLLTPDYVARVKDKLISILAVINPTSQIPTELATMYDCWEWQERQAKYVVNGQRIYDFLELDWRLPLWDLEWMKFWPNVPVDHRLGRKLYKAYLRHWDFHGLFSESEPVVHHWPGATMPFFILAQGVGLLGRRAKDTWYRYTRWFGHYGYQWHSYPLAHFLRDTQQARNVLALFAETWVSENLNIKKRPLSQFKKY